MTPLFKLNPSQFIQDETFLEKPKKGGEISVALVYPNEYSVGISSLGYQTVWKIINSYPSVYCERAFTGRFPQNPVKTVESKRSIGEFDIIAFSLSFELDALNIVSALKNSGVPLEADKRRGDAPLILIGGVVPTLNPEPLAEIADVVLIGEAEESLPELLERLLELRGAERNKLLAGIAKVPGVYVPKFYRVEYGAGIEIVSRHAIKADAPSEITRRRVTRIDDYPVYSAILTPYSEFGDMGLVEISRGCAGACRFCAAGFIYRPVRYRSVASITPCIEKLLEHRERIGLVASSGTEHPQVEEIIEVIEKRGGKVSFASLRVELIGDEILKAIARSSKTITIAPEAGSEKLRQAVGKAEDEDVILDAVERITACGIPNIKLYFMVGLPNETMDDINDVSELVRKIVHMHCKKKSHHSVSVSVAPFVPKPHTPFGYHPMEREEKIQAKINVLRPALRKIGVQARFENISESFFQAVISRGDRRVHELFKRAVKLDGSITRLLKDAPNWVSDIVYIPRTVQDSLPWDFIKAHIGESHLYDEYHRGLLAQKVVPCKPARCKSCSACSG